MSGFFHEPADSYGWDERADEYRLAEQEWEDHLIAKELKRRERLDQHKPLGGKPAPAGSVVDGEQALGGRASSRQKKEAA